MSGYQPPRLRNVLKSDLAAIAELEATAFGSDGLKDRALDVYYDPSGGLWLLAEDEEGVWGYSMNARAEDPHVGWILGMAIHPRRQGRGWGTILLEATVNRLYGNDMNVIRLLVKSTNKVARHLYENFGFKETGERRDHLGPGQDRMLMSLLLEGGAPPLQHAIGTPRMSSLPGDTTSGRINRVARPQVPEGPDFS